MPRRHSLVLLAVFLLSVLVRTPQLGRPLSKHHEFCTAVALVVMDVWWERGWAECTGCPAVTFSGTCDGEAKDLAPDYMQRNGVRFYISHMPLAYWVPYAAFKSLGVPPAPLPLQLFNLLLHGLTAFFLYRFLATLVAGCSTPGLADAPLFAAVFYLLMPAPLWYHGNVYMSDMAVQLPWAWSLAAGAKVFKRKHVELRRSGWFLLAIAATALTEWLGLFTALTFGGYALSRGLKHKDRGSLLLGAVIPFVAIALMGAVLALYINIAGAHAAWAYYMNRWAERGSFVPGEGVPSSSFIIGLPKHFLMAYGPLLLLIAIGVLRSRRGPTTVGMRSAWLWMTLPALVHIVVFLRYTGHEFAVLKFGFLLCAWAAFVLARWREREPAMANIAFVSTCCLGIAMYTVENRPGDGTATGDRYDVAMQRGLFIARNARMDERVFETGAVLEPQLIWYARRNLTPLPLELDSAFQEAGSCPEVHFVFSGDSCAMVRLGL